MRNGVFHGLPNHNTFPSSVLCTLEHGRPFSAAVLAQDTCILGPKDATLLPLNVCLHRISNGNYYASKKAQLLILASTYHVQLIVDYTPPPSPSLALLSRPETSQPIQLPRLETASPTVDPF